MILWFSTDQAGTYTSHDCKPPEITLVDRFKLQFFHMTRSIYRVDVILRSLVVNALGTKRLTSRPSQCVRVVEHACTLSHLGSQRTGQP